MVFAAGETVKQVLVSVNGDVRQEEEETFLLRIVSADYATIADGEATGTIAAEDFQFLAAGPMPAARPRCASMIR